MGHHAAPRGAAAAAPGPAGVRPAVSCPRADRGRAPHLHDPGPRAGADLRRAVPQRADRAASHPGLAGAGPADLPRARLCPGSVRPGADLDQRAVDRPRLPHRREGRPGAGACRARIRRPRRADADAPRASGDDAVRSGRRCARRCAGRRSPGRHSAGPAGTGVRGPGRGGPSRTGSGRAGRRDRGEAVAVRVRCRRTRHSAAGRSAASRSAAGRSAARSSRSQRSLANRSLRHPRRWGARPVRRHHDPDRAAARCGPGARAEHGPDERDGRVRRTCVSSRSSSP